MLKKYKMQYLFLPNLICNLTPDQSVIYILWKRTWEKITVEIACMHAWNQVILVSKQSSGLKPLSNWLATSSSHKLNLLRDLRWVAKPTRKFPRKYTKVAKNSSIISRQAYPVFHRLIIGSWASLNLRWLGFAGHTVKNLGRLACKFHLDQSERESSQVNACARKAWPNVYLKLRLAGALLSWKTKQMKFWSHWKLWTQCQFKFHHDS